MGRQKYKSYLKSPIFHTQKGVPRQTTYNIRKRFQRSKIVESIEAFDSSTQYVQQESGDDILATNDNSDNDGLSAVDSTDAESTDDEETRNEPGDAYPTNASTSAEGESYIHPNLTVKEGSLLVFAFLLRHRLTNVGVQHLLDLIRMFCPGCNFPSSKFLLKKELSITYESLNYHYYCKSCKNLMLQNEKNCPKCRTTASNNFFITFDVQKSLESILQQEEVSSNLFENLTTRTTDSNEDQTTYREIFHGQKYRQLPLLPFDFTATMNCDGVPCYRSSNFSISPFLLSINELSYKFRRKYTFVAALWFGQEKPSMRTFLPPIVEMLNKVTAEGIKWRKKDECIISHVLFPMLAADSVARCSLQGINQFNGKFGCPWCLEKGETFWENESSHKWIYRTHAADLRNQNQFINDLKSFRNQLKLKPSLKSFNGIQDASALLLLKHFDIVSGFVFDYMHTIELGVCRTFTNAWLDSKYKDRPFYIGNKLQILNSRIRNWRMPFTSDRTIRVLDERKHWKSSEWRIWTFISPFILKDVLPSAYFAHFLKFVQSVFLLLGRRVHYYDISGIRESLQTFVESVEGLYGTSFCSFNVHLLIHATNCVENWGPLWNYSLFHFENYNGILLKYFKASYKIEAQISNKIVENSHVLTTGFKLFKNVSALYFYEELIEKRRIVEKCTVDFWGCLLLGSSRPYILNSYELKLLCKLGYPEVVACESYKRGYVNNIHLNIQSNITSKRCACVVNIDSKIFLIKSIILVTFLGGQTGCFLICTELKATQLVRSYSAAFNVRSENTIKLFRASSVAESCYYTNLLSNNVPNQIVLLPNAVESE